MANFSFLHAADIHLDSPLTGLSRYEGVPADQVRAAPRAAFDRLIAIAIERQVAFVIIAGDLYDGDWRDMGTGLYFAAAMGRLGRAGIPVFLLAGNHDAQSIITKDLPKLANVHLFPTGKPGRHQLPHLDVVVHGRSFAERSVTENLAASYPDAVRGAFNIGVLHTSLGGYAEHATYAPCTRQELVSRGYQYWALGHVHEYEVVCEAPHIVFPGNIQGRNIREDGPRGAVLVHVQDGQVAEMERLALDVVRWARVNVAADGLAEFEALHHRIRTALRDTRAAAPEDRALILRLTITGATQLHGALQDEAQRLRDDVRGIAAEIAADMWIEKIRVRTSPPDDLVSTEESGESGLQIPAPDATLAEALRVDFEKFLAGLPPIESEQIRLVREGDWTAIMETAHAALRHRLGQAA